MDEKYSEKKISEVIRELITENTEWDLGPIASYGTFNIVVEGYTFRVSFMKIGKKARSKK